MRVASLLPLVCSVLPASEPAGWSCWKREGLDSSGRAAWVDSIFHDTAGKPLLERRRDAGGKLLSTVAYAYGMHGYATGRKLRIQGPSGDSAILEAFCEYRMEGGEPHFSSWMGGVDSGRAQIWAGNMGWRPDTTFTWKDGVVRFATRNGHVTKAGMRAHGRAETEAVFAYDSLGRHVATRFSRRAGMRIGRDTVIRDSAGRPVEWALRDARGRRLRRETWVWNRDGLLRERGSQADSASPATAIRYGWAPRDSAPLAIGMRSRHPGAAKGRPCAFSWTDAIPFDFEPFSLEGLFLDAGRPGKFKPRPDIEGLFPEEFMIEDTCHAFQEDTLIHACHNRAEAKRKADYFGPLCGCLAAPTGPCVDTLVAAVVRLLDGVDTPQLPDRALDSVTGVLLRRGPPEAERLLLRAVREETQREDLWQALLGHLLRRRVERGYEAFIATGGHVALPARAPAGADRADSAAVGSRLAAAWDYRQRVLAVDPSLPLPPKDKRAMAAGRDGCVLGVLDWMRSGDARDLRSAESLRRWHEDGEEEGDAKDELSLARLAEALEAGRLGAVLRRTGPPGLIRRILVSRGLDWEAYLLGYLGDPLNFDWRQGYQAHLARYGSQAAAEALVGMPTPPGVGIDRGFTLILGAMAAAPGAEPGIPASFLPDAPGPETAFRRDPSAGPLPPRLRARALARLLSPLEADPLESPALDILSVLAMEDVPGREDYLAMAAAIPEEAIRDSALSLLGRFYPRQKTPAALIPLEPVRFRLISGGRPLGRQGVSAEGMGRADSYLAGWRDGREFGSDSDGYFEIDRMEYMRMLKGSREIAFTSRMGTEPGAPLFRARVEAGEWPAGTVTVEVPLRRVSIIPELPPGFIPAQESRANLRIWSGFGGDAESPVSIPWRDTLVSPAWGDGEYRVELSVPGLRTEVLPPFRVAGRDMAVRIRMRRGADVSVIVMSAFPAERDRMLGVFVADRDGREWKPSNRDGGLLDPGVGITGQPILFEGLPPGDYVFKVRGSRDMRAWLKAKRSELTPYGKHLQLPGSIVPDPLRLNHKPFAYAFRVPAEGPDDLDLGRLRLEADSPGDVPPVPSRNSPKRH